jgi:hypothetical protein
MRKQALYVEPSDNGWNRPADLSEGEARQLVMEALNDYSSRSQDLDLRELLDQLPDRPKLPLMPAPTWMWPNEPIAENWVSGPD